jgi:hypothetical protein
LRVFSTTATLALAVFGSLRTGFQLYAGFEKRQIPNKGRFFWF